MNRSRYLGKFLPTVCAIALLGLLPVRAQAQAKLTKNLFQHVMKSADVDAQFAKITDSWDAYTKTNHAVTFRVATTPQQNVNHQEADEYWMVRKGTARVTINAATPQTATVNAGDVVYVPRTLPYTIEPSSRFEYVAVRLFAPVPVGGGAASGPAPTSYFATKAQIDQTFASESRSTNLRFPGGNVNMIIYNGAIGPYESHEYVDQIYFVRSGTAKIALDGRLVNPVVTGPGQIRGTGYIDSSEYTIGPGDIVWIPRNQLHFVDPGTGKIGYFLIGTATSKSAFPEPPPAPARGAGGAQ